MAALAAPAAQASPGGYAAGTASSFSVFARGTDGGLSLLASPAAGAGSQPNGVAMSPDGRHFYVGNALAGAAGSTSTRWPRTPLCPASIATVGTAGAANSPEDPTALVVSPDGQSQYAALGPSWIAQYNIAADGTLSVKAPEFLASSGGAPVNALAVTPDGGQLLFAAGAYTFENHFDTIPIDAGGVLGASSDVSGGALVNGPLAFDPSARFLYIAGEYSGVAGGVDS